MRPPPTFTGEVIAYTTEKTKAFKKKRLDPAEVGKLRSFKLEEDTEVPGFPVC